MLVVFPGVGVYPFLVWHLVAVGGLAMRRHPARAIATRRRGRSRCCCPAGALASLASFLVANPIGDNVARLRYAVFPLLLLLAVRRRATGARLDRRRSGTRVRGRARPDPGGRAGGRAAARTRRPGRRPLAYLRDHLPPGARVEVVPTSARWEAYYLPTRGIPLARGWFRQTDMARNRLLYRRTLTRCGVRRVARALRGRSTSC